MAAHILIAEDDKKTAETLRLYLEHAGYRVILAFNGAQALELIVTVFGVGYRFEGDVA